MRALFLPTFIAVLSLTVFPLHAHAAAATITLRTGMVDAINSIARTGEDAEVRRTGALPVAIYRLDFSITAHEMDLAMPFAVTRGASDAQGLEFLIESRGGTTTESGVALGVLIADNAARSGSAYVIKAGTTERFSLLALFADQPDSSREDRLRVSGMTLAVPKLTAELNPSELSDLHTGYVELIETR
jgi:hypothetical protein